MKQSNRMPGKIRDEECMNERFKTPSGRSSNRASKVFYPSLFARRKHGQRILIAPSQPQEFFIDERSGGGMERTSSNVELLDGQQLVGPGVYRGRR